MKLDAGEKELLESVDRGEWRSASRGKRERARYSRYAKATFRKDRRLNIRLSSKDLEAIQKRALAEGLPYQTLISSLLHKLRVRAAQGGLGDAAISRREAAPREKRLGRHRVPLRQQIRLGTVLDTFPPMPMRFRPPLAPDRLHVNIQRPRARRRPTLHQRRKRRTSPMPGEVPRFVT